MKLFIVAGFIMVTTCCPAQEAPDAFRDDQRLRTPISMREKIVSMATFVADLSRLSNVKFQVAAEIRDRKVTTIFHDRSTAELMEAVQSALFLQWIKVGDGYRLTMPASSRRDEKQLLDAEESTAAASIRDRLAEYLKIAEIPPNRIPAEIQATRNQIDELNLNPSSGSRSKVEDAKQRFGALSNPAGIPIAQAYAADLSSLVDALMAGRTAFASTRPADNVPQMPGDAARFLPLDAQKAIDIMSMLRYDPAAGRFVGRSSCFLGLNMGSISTRAFTCELEESRELDKSKLLAVLRGWSSSLDESLMNQKIAQNGPQEEPPGYLNGGFTLADHLEFLADRSGVPVVADAYRVSLSPGAYRGELTVGEYMKGLQHSYLLPGSRGSTVFGCYGTSKGWLLARHSGYWRREKVEIPESVLLPLEQVVKSSPYPLADNYAAFIRKLTPDQETAFSMNLLGRAFRFPQIPLVAALYSLKLWAALAPEQRAVASTEPGLELAQLTSDQMQIVAQGWANGIWNGHLPGELWEAVFTPSKISALGATLRFAQTTDTMVLSDGELAVVRQKTPSPPGTGRGVHVQFDFMVGLQPFYTEGFGILGRGK